MSDTIRTALRACPFCEASCGLELTLQGDRLTGVRGHKGDAFSHGYICPKGAALKDLHEDPDRLRTPLIRRDGRHVEATWDEAFAEIAARLPPILAAHGRRAGALTIGNPAAHKMALLLYFPALARALGSPNVFSASTLDQMPKQLASAKMFGHWLTVAVPDIERADFMLILGANPAVSNGSMWTVPDVRAKLRALRDRGGFVTIDPRRTETAEIGGEHVFIRPGGDAAFLLGLIHTLFAENLVRTGRLAPLLAGLDTVRAAVAPFPPEAVAARCGIAPDTIRALARRLAAAPRACVYGRIGTCTQRFGTVASWLIDVANILTGHLDEPGCAMFPMAPAFAANTLGKAGQGRGVTTGRHRSRVNDLPEIYGELPMAELATEIETPGEGQIRALITVASNPASSAPNAARLSAALARLDFMVSLDIYRTETTRHANVILPGLSPLEESHYDVAFTQLAHRNFARYSAPVLPRGDRPAEWEILLRLAAIAEHGRDPGAAGIAALDDDYFSTTVRKGAGTLAGTVLAAQARSPARGPERALDTALRTGPYGDRYGLKKGLSLAKLAAAEGAVDLGPLAPRLPDALRTPSGRVELAPADFVTDLAHVLADLDTPAPAMAVIGRRDVRSNNSWMHNLPILAKGPERCTALVSPADAARLGLADGAPARLTGAGPAIEATVRVTDAMPPGLVSLPHGFGQSGPGLSVASARPGANLNVLLDDAARDPLSGNAVLSGGAITIAPVMAEATLAA